MKQIQRLSLNDFNNLLKKRHIYPSYVVFWVGCGIDHIKPTNLPLASELLQTLLLKTCGQHSTKLLQIWKTVKNEIDKLSISENEFASIPRMESIIEQFLLCEQNMKESHTILPVIMCFKDAPPNENHFSLASAILCGANVVTTNYSLCIQKAISLLQDGIEFKIQQPENDSLTYVYQSNHPGAGAIYHIHGVATEGSQIGASLSKVKASLSPMIIEKIETWLQEKKVFIFCGYSGNDSFDVNRYFLSKEDNCTEAIGVFLRHSSDKTDEYLSKIFIHEKEQILLHMFQDRYIIETNTSNVLAKFANIKRSIEPEEFCWKEKCQMFEYPPQYHKNLLIQICSFLGINVNLVIGEDWLPNVVEQNCYSHWYTDYPCLSMARLQGDTKLIARFGENLKQYKNEHLMNREIRAARREYDIYSQQDIDMSYELVCQALGLGVSVDWNLSSLINQQTDYIIGEIISCQTRAELFSKREQFKSRVLGLLETCQMIISHNYDSIIEMNQLHLVLRNAAILQSIATSDYTKATEYLKQSTYLYVEVSSIDGIIGNLNIAQIIYFMEYLDTRKRDSLINAYENYKAAKII